MRTVWIQVSIDKTLVLIWILTVCHSDSDPKIVILEKADFLRKKNQQVTNTIEITQRAEFITCGLIEIIHGPTCALGALRIIYVYQFYIKISIFEIYEKRQMNTGIRRKISKKIVIVRDSNPHIRFLRTQSYPLCYLEIVDNLIQIIVPNIKLIFTKSHEQG